MSFVKDSQGRLFVTPYPTEGSKKTIISHRWNDPTTWAEQSVEVVDQAASASVAGTSYDLPDQNVIDTYHGKIFAEDSLGKRVSVEVDTGGGFAAVTEKDPHTLAGDYTVDYAAGTITFDPAIDVGASVRASYWKAAGSRYTVKPSSGKKLIIDSAEVQFAADTELADTVRFLVYGLADVFAPHMLTTADPPGPIPPGTLIEIKRTIYKSLHNFIDESNGANPEIRSFPVAGVQSWRGTDQPITVFPWSYQAALELRSDYGMEIRIDCEHDDPFGGSYATCTMYCLSEDL